MSLDDRFGRTVIKADIVHLASLEEISWRKKFKVLFIKEGDNNTRFFIGRLTCTIEPIALGEWRLRECFMSMIGRFKIRWWNFIRIYNKSLNLGGLPLMA